MVTDPVCLVKMEENKAKVKLEYRGQTYYFHDERCKQIFENDPSEYVTQVMAEIYGDKERLYEEEE